jgi:DNA transposition AAA+ family ATPase
MIRNKFVTTANVHRFLNGVTAVEQRGAPESAIMLVQGQPGHGKSQTGMWWAMRKNAVFVRLTASTTPKWVLTDLVRELMVEVPARSCEKLFAQAIGVLARDQRPIVVDETENALHDLKVLETLRDITDLVSVPLVLLGREFCAGKLRRHPHIWSRISSIVDMGPASEADVRNIFDQLCEVPVADDVVKVVTGQSEGRVREVINAVANVERFTAKRKDAKPVTMEELGDKPLTREYQARQKVA